MNNESIDFRVLISLVIDHWLWVAVVAALAGAIALGISLLLPRFYQAEATLVVSPSRTEVQFDPRIVTVEDYELSRGTVDARREALTALVTSNEVVTAVLGEVGGSLEPEQRAVRALRDMINVETAGDLINLEVRHRDAQTAMQIANVWAELYEQHVNQLYSSASTASRSRVGEQVESAQQTYEVAQAALESYETEDRSVVLQQELDAKMAILENYQQARIAAETRPVDRDQAILNNYYTELAQAEAWLADAEALRGQVADNDGSAAGNVGNALALIMLRGRAFGGQASGEASGIALMIDISDPTAEQVTTSDVDALMTALQARREAAQARIDSFLQGIEGGGGPAQIEQLDMQINGLTAEIADLQSELEGESAKRRELVQARDRAWDTYQVLIGRQVEEQITSESASTEVRIADTAIVPTEPVPRGTIRNTLLASVVSAILAIFVLLAYAIWNVDELGVTASGQRDAEDAGSDDQGRLEEDRGSIDSPGLPETLAS